jgi:hypothetical protein
MAKRKARQTKKATSAASKRAKRPGKRVAPKAKQTNRQTKKTKRATPAKRATRGTIKRAAVKRRPAATRRPAARAARVTRKATPAPARKKAAAAPRASVRPRAPKAARGAPKATRLDRVRRTLDETVQMPPSSLNMDRRGSAARTGRAEMAESALNHRGMDPSIAAGDVDVDVEDAYFTGEEAPGGDNPTPDQDVVDDIGKALGVQYEDNEELKAADKVIERDRKRWELDPASAEDYKDRK